MFLEVNDLAKGFNGEDVVKGLTFSLASHQTLSILGKSGCGKTTMLKMLGGLVRPDRGDIILDGQRLNDQRPGKRGVVYLYQEDLLFPHLDVFGNIAFGLGIRKRPKAEIKEKVEKMIEHLELQGQAHKMPHQLSGGQRQRVSFGRAIITNPQLLLLDEPFGSLDVGTRQRMQELFKELAHDYRITSLFVTHDLKEAILMGDQLAFMRSGRLKVYPNKDAFINDPETGVQDEIGFWDGLKVENS